MFGWLVTIVGIVGCFVLYGKVGATSLFWVAVVVVVVQLWTFGILWNYRKEDRTPGAVAMINTITTIGCIGVLIYGIAV